MLLYNPQNVHIINKMKYVPYHCPWKQLKFQLLKILKIPELEKLTISWSLIVSSYLNHLIS